MSNQEFRIGDYLMLTTYAKYVDYDELDINCSPYVVSLASPIIPNRIFFLPDLRPATVLSTEEVPAEIRKSLDQCEQEYKKRVEKNLRLEEQAALKFFGIEDDGEVPEAPRPEGGWQPTLDDEIF